jgi:hypothetical protein
MQEYHPDWPLAFRLPYTKRYSLSTKKLTGLSKKKFLWHVPPLKVLKLYLNPSFKLLPSKMKKKVILC